MREAYRLKGWAFNNADGIVQCEREGWTNKLKEQAEEGCTVFGFLLVNKVAGNFHFAPGKSFQQHNVHIHDLQPFGRKAFNMTHCVKRLSFGTDYPGLVNPLDEHVEVAQEGGSAMFQYFIKVVPTRYTKLNGQQVSLAMKWKRGRTEMEKGNQIMEKNRKEKKTSKGKKEKCG